MQPRGTPGFAPGHRGRTTPERGGTRGFGSVPPGRVSLGAECDVIAEQERTFRTNETETTDAAGKFRLCTVCDPNRKAFIVTLKFCRT